MCAESAKKWGTGSGSALPSDDCLPAKRTRNGPPASGSSQPHQAVKKLKGNWRKAIAADGVSRMEAKEAPEAKKAPEAKGSLTSPKQ